MEQNEIDFKKYVFEYFDGAVLWNSDDLTVVIRAHLLVENIIERILAKSLRLEVFDDRELTFSFKLKMAQSLNLLDDLYPAIKRLNNIRNEFAHNIETKMQSVDITILIDLFESKGGRNLPGWEEILKNKKVCFGTVIHYILGRLHGIIEKK